MSPGDSGTEAFEEKRLSVAPRWAVGPRIPRGARVINLPSLLVHFCRFCHPNFHTTRRRANFPLALNGHPGRFRHFLNSFGLFFNCNSTEATISALGVSRSAISEKQVDLPRRESRCTNLEFTRKRFRATAIM